MFRFELRQEIIRLTELIRSEPDVRQRELLEARRDKAEAELNTLELLSSPIWHRDDVMLMNAADQALEHAIKTFRAQFANIQILNHAAGGLIILAQKNLPALFLQHFALVKQNEGSACARCLSSGECNAIDDVLADHAYARHHDIARKTDYRAVCSAPLNDAEGRQFGIISVLFREPRRFTIDDLTRMTTIASHTSASLLRWLPQGAAVDYAARS